MNFYSGIVKFRKRLNRINEILNILNSSSIPGATKLVKNFLSPDAQSGSKQDPSSISDILLEIFIMWKLMNDNRISNLVYEPSDCKNPPDFRFNIDKICYDLEVKYIRPYEEIRLFKAECEKFLSNIQKPWYFIYQLRYKFQKYHIDMFISYLKDQINTFQTNTDYHWPTKNDYLVYFKFDENASGKPPISIGMTIGSMLGVDNLVLELRRRIEKIILDTKKKMVNIVGPLQSNLLLLQIENEYPMTGNSEVAILHRVFYDAGGLFHQENKENLFPWLSGVIMLKSGIGLPDQSVEGSFFINPINKEIVKNHPKLFKGIRFISIKGDGGRLLQFLCSK